MLQSCLASRQLFGILADGSPVDIITLAGYGVVLEVLTYGAVIRSLRVPDRNGAVDDIVLGYDTLAEYATDRFFTGAIVGRYANRIRHGHFVLAGRLCELPINDPPHHLHGGPNGFHRKVWRAELAQSAGRPSVRLSRSSPDGEEGYPGNLDVEVTYTLTEKQELVVEYHAATDRTTPVNLTQHSYFNLRGAANGTIHDHELVMHVVGYLPVDETAIPLDHMEAIAPGPFDFAHAAPIGTQLRRGHEQLRRASGFDHCFVVRRDNGSLCRAAALHEPSTGRTLEVWTTEPGIQLYTGQFLVPTRGRKGAVYGPCSGLCLETQHFPDSPNRPEFPCVLLRPRQPFYSRTVFRFGVTR
jgi:aldose 1-epimerase